jgi:outer membrane protein OmpA-like peptidoglycan-associated protein/tetratricopeptide (TPR) repeat protein
MKKLIIPIIVLMGISMTTIAQEKSRKEKKGDKYAFKYAYNDAIDSYNHTKHLSVEGQRNLAYSYHRIDKNIESEVAYSKLITTAQGIVPEDYYNYAVVLKINGKYDDANKAMDKFNELKPTDLRAKDYEANKDKFNDILKDDGKYKLLHLDLNSDAQDFGTCFYKDKIVFSSTRATPKWIKRTYNLNGKPFLNMYVSDIENGQLKTPQIFEKSFDDKMHDGPASFSKDGAFVAYTRNIKHDKRKDKVVDLQICFSNYKDGKWSKPESFAYDNEAYSVGHPCLSADGNTMYFASDIPGGFGGADIYKTIKDEKGIWGVPVNLGNKVNTEGDELFPFYEESTKTLLFASNGHFGLGGLDIFISKKNNLGIDTVYNAGAPLNTQYDDFAVIVNDKMQGYFSSNRPGGNGDDDIYSVEFVKGLEIRKTIAGVAKDKSGAPVAKTFITLRDVKGNAIDTVTTKDDAAYSFLVDANQNYKLNGKKATYMDGDTIASTFGKEATVTADVILLKKEEIIAEKIKVGTDLVKIKELEFNAIYFDLDKFNIRPDAATELDKIVKVMNQFPDMKVELGSYTDCRETKAYNQILSDKRAKTSANYIKKRITKPERIYGKGYGKTKLVNGCACDGNVVSDCSEEEHQKNRRSEFIIINSATAKK